MHTFPPDVCNANAVMQSYLYIIEHIEVDEKFITS